MLIAGLGVVVALAFVLGLGALSLWILKRYTSGGLTPRCRVQLEVVQRVALGPKNGLAVVRVGEKVMAVSVGDGGIRALFELDEHDRQRVLATSRVATPQASSDAAHAAFAPVGVAGSAAAAGATATTPAFTEGFGVLLRKVLRSAAPATGATATQQTTQRATVGSMAGAEPDAWFTEPALDPAWIATVARATPITAPIVSPGAASRMTSKYAAPEPLVIELAPRERAFRSMLRLSLSTATRLAVFTGAMLVASATPLWGQAAGATPPAGSPPPVLPPTVPPASVTPATVLPSTSQPAVPAVAPPTLSAPPLLSGGATTPTIPQFTAPTIALPPVAIPQAPRPVIQPGRATRPAAAAPRPGNGAATTAQGAATTRTAGQMVLDTMKRVPESLTNAAQPAPIAADDAIMRLMPQMDVKLGGDAETGGLRLNGTVGIVVMMGLLTMLPTLMLMMTGFTRILIVLHFLKQAMGTQSAPPAHLLSALALLLTGFVMTPTLSQMNREAVTPWLDGKITQVEMMKTGIVPMREFMLRQTRESDLKTFVEMSRMEQPETVDDVPLHVLMSAFVASELRTAFQIGFAIYLPFIIIDAVVASVLMSMGMFMLPPAMISLPFKLLLFVLVDGWSLTITSLVQSFK